MASFTLFQSPKDRQFYFNLKADNHKIILQSEGYKTKSGCMNGIDSVRINASFDTRFDRKLSSNGEFFFTLQAANGEPIGKSETYPTEAAMEIGIQSVKKNAGDAELIDEIE